MEARLVSEIPRGDNWQYEPKWDGFRCIGIREENAVELQSKSGNPLARYFPEIVEALREVGAERFSLDGELVVKQGDEASFDDLLQRIHPAASRVATLARESPALYVVFDILQDPEHASLVATPLAERRAILERFFEHYISPASKLRLSPATRDFGLVEDWFARTGGALDGVVAKRVDARYDSGGRDAMVKVKRIRSADCVVGGFRKTQDGGAVASLLLGLYGEDGVLDYVGFTSGFRSDERAKLLPRLRGLEGPPAFGRRAPGGPSRWNRGRDAAWTSLKPELVLEVAFDQVTAGRFRHGTKPLRWRPDKLPRSCTTDQLRIPDRTIQLA